MLLTSNDIQNNQLIAAKFTCDGENIVPQLQWRDVPAGAKSLALSCLDPDSPTGEWAHWLVVDIPAEIEKIEQNGTLPAGALEVVNDFGYAHYGGPCPGSGRHRYYFKIYALAVDKLPDVTRDNFKQKVQEHTIESAGIMGYYQRPK